VTDKKLNISYRKFGRIATEEIYEYKLSNQDIEIRIINFGCIITSIEVPDTKGNKKNVVAGFDNLDQYLYEHPYFGAIIGRYANRISEGKFAINGRKYELPVNSNTHH
jgi:aldose 1-epimerase